MRRDWSRRVARAKVRAAHSITRWLPCAMQPPHSVKTSGLSV